VKTITVSILLFIFLRFSVIMRVSLCANVCVLFVILHNALQLYCIYCLQADVAKLVDEKKKLMDQVANLESSIESVSNP